MNFSASSEQKMRRFTGTIPEELVINILLRVPPETLVELKSVCKSWLSLISSSEFTKSHLAITAAEEKEEIHIVHTYEKENISEDSISLINLGTRELVITMNFPSMLCEKLVGCACGIVCLSTAGGSNMYLWNPATNLSKLIPSPPSSLSDDDKKPLGFGFDEIDKTLGFGFDQIDNDFKIVRFVWRVKLSCSHRKYRYCYAQDCEEIYVEVYSSNRNTWRKLPDKPTDLPYKYADFDVSVKNGLLCCTGTYGIITFDLHTEVLTSAGINYPVPTFDTNKSNINNFVASDNRAHVTNFKDSIGVIIYKHTNDFDSCIFNLWALDNVECLRGGGIEASWTLTFNIDVNFPVSLVSGYLNSGDLLLYLLTRDMCLYNSDKKETTYFTNSFIPFQVFKYSKSLFTIPGFKQVNWNAPLHEAGKQR